MGGVIERYTRPEMGRVWSEAHKYELWCQVETLVLEAQARAGTVPPDSVAAVRAAPPPTPAAVAAFEAVTQHDVIAFLTAWADNTSPREAAAYVHFGMTSSDLLDTALAVQLTEASDLLIAQASALVAALREHGLAHPARCGSAGPTASTPSRTCGGTGWPTSRSRWRAPGTGCVRAREAVAVGEALRGRSARTPPSTRRSRPPCSPGSGCGRPTWPPRWCSATASPSG